MWGIVLLELSKLQSEIKIQGKLKNTYLSIHLKITKVYSFHVNKVLFFEEVTLFQSKKKIVIRAAFLQKS